MTEHSRSTELLRALAEEEGRRDPYPLYDELRQLPVAYDDHHKAYVVTGYADCRTALSGRDFDRPASDFFDRRIPGWREHPAIVCGSRMMQFGDAESHARRRGAVADYFTLRRVRALVRQEEADVERLLDDLAGAFERDGVVDLQAGLSVRLPSVTIAALFGIPEEDATRFRPLVMAIVAGLEPGLTPQQLTACDHAYARLHDYFARVVAERRRVRRDDLSGHIVASHDAGAPTGLLAEEIVPMFLSLFAAGTMNTGSFIGNGAVALLSTPGQAELLRRDPERAEDAVTEILRYDAPMQFTRRTTVADTEIGGTAVPRGSHLAVALGAANRDPSVYADPHAFRIGRPGPTPLSLGGGRFYCIGAALGRQEGSLVFRRLFRRFPTLRLAGTPVPNLRAVLRGYLEVPVALEAGATGAAA
ncbi:cytochrome P450 [Streptomyces sp. NPDC005805]|uniref:cytochrome P450 n=1 Tax=Streptomyces sp. NPDC005805 TaxID=3157068 RepID=UPI0033F5DCC8